MGEKFVGENRDFKGIWIPKELYLNDELSWTEKIFLLEASSLQKNGECFATNEYFANFLGISKGTVSKMVSRLKEKGYISTEIIYKQRNPNKKPEVDKRVIKVNDPSGYKRIGGMSEKSHRGMSEKGQVINTSFNNTIINTLNSGSLEKDEKPHDGANNDLILRTAKNVCDEEIPAEDECSKQQILKMIGYYLNSFYEATGKYHPPISISAMRKIVNTLFYPDDNSLDDYLYNDDSIKALVDRHFTTDYGKQIDYHLQHFATKGILSHQAYNVLY